MKPPGRLAGGARPASDNSSGLCRFSGAAGIRCCGCDETTVLLETAFGGPGWFASIGAVGRFASADCFGAGAREGRSVSFGGAVGLMVLAVTRCGAGTGCGCGRGCGRGCGCGCGFGGVVTFWGVG